MPFYTCKEYIQIMRPLPSYVERDIYDIPFIESQPIDLSALNNEKWLINMKNAKPDDIHADKKLFTHFVMITFFAEHIITLSIFYTVSQSIMLLPPSIFLCIWVWISGKF